MLIQYRKSSIYRSTAKCNFLSSQYSLAIGAYLLLGYEPSQRIEPDVTQIALAEVKKGGNHTDRSASDFTVLY